MLCMLFFAVAMATVARASCTIYLFSGRNCGGHKVGTSYITNKNQEWPCGELYGDGAKKCENDPQSAWISTDCDKVEFYDEDYGKIAYSNNYGKSGYEDNFVVFARGLGGNSQGRAFKRYRSGSSQNWGPAGTDSFSRYCWTFPDDIRNDLGGIKATFNFRKHHYKDLSGTIGSNMEDFYAKVGRPGRDQMTKRMANEYGTFVLVAVAAACLVLFGVAKKMGKAVVPEEEISLVADLQSSGDKLKERGDDSDFC